MKVFTDRRSYNFFCSVQVFELVYFILSTANNLKKKNSYVWQNSIYLYQKPEILFISLWVENGRLCII